MLEPLKHVLSNYRVVLASGSPRRKELLSTSGLGPFEVKPLLPVSEKFALHSNLFSCQVIPSKAEENLDKSSYVGRPWKYAEDTAELKVQYILILAPFLLIEFLLTIWLLTTYNLPFLSAGIG